MAGYSFTILWGIMLQYAKCWFPTIVIKVSEWQTLEISCKSPVFKNVWIIFHHAWVLFLLKVFSKLTQGVREGGKLLLYISQLFLWWLRIIYTTCLKGNKSAAISCEYHWRYNIWMCCKERIGEDHYENRYIFWQCSPPVFLWKVCQLNCS